MQERVSCAINAFFFIFANVLHADSKSGEELSHPKSAPALTGGNKEYIRVYINSDTTFRSFVVASEETVREFLQRIAPKLSLSDDYNEGKRNFNMLIPKSRRDNSPGFASVHHSSPVMSKIGKLSSLCVCHVILVSRRPVNEFAYYNDLICCYVALNISESIHFRRSLVRVSKFSFFNFMLNQPPLYLTISIRTVVFGFAELGGLNHANVTYRQFSKTSFVRLSSFFHFLTE